MLPSNHEDIVRIGVGVKFLTRKPIVLLAGDTRLSSPPVTKGLRKVAAVIPAS